MVNAHGLVVDELRGSRPRFRWPLWRMVLTGRVEDDFAFTWTPSTALGYTGCARKLRGLEVRQPDFEVQLRRVRLEAVADVEAQQR